MACCDRRLSLGATESVCPTCLATVAAERFAEGDVVYLRKTCPEHGAVVTPIWRGLDSYLRWGLAPRAYSRPSVAATPVERGCPHDCGLCSDHRQQSCCVLLEVTSRCDLACPVCYASASRNGVDASLDEIDGWLDTLAEAGGRVHIQLSGGEPTTRDDLPEIVARVRARGFDFVQLNTNGVRIAREPAYLAALAEAGLDCVFLQFDGVTDDVYRRLRGAKLMRLKAQAIDNCGAAGVGVVLTPTLVPGVNVGEIGAIVDFAVAHMPAVRAVHFQPVSYFGRCLAEPDAASRITLPEVMEALIAHSGGTIRLDDFRPGSAENPYCSFSGRFVVDAAGRMRPAAEARPSCCGAPVEPQRTACCDSARPSSDVARERRYVAGQWTRADRAAAPVAGLDAFDAFLADQRAHARTFRHGVPGRLDARPRPAAPVPHSRRLARPARDPVLRLQPDQPRRPLALSRADRRPRGGRVSAATLDPWMAARMGLAAPLTRQAIADWQFARLNETIAHARAASPFYRARRDWPDGPLGGVEDLARLPFTTAADLSANDPPLLALSQSAVARVVTLETSGTQRSAEAAPFHPRRSRSRPSSSSATAWRCSRGRATAWRSPFPAAILAASLRGSRSRCADSAPFLSRRRRRSIRPRSPRGCETRSQTSSPGRRFRCWRRRASPPTTAARQSAPAPCC